MSYLNGALSSANHCAVKMARRESADFAKRVIHYYENQCNKNKLLTVRHFAAEGKSRALIYNIIRRFEASGSVEYKKLSGRPAYSQKHQSCEGRLGYTKADRKRKVPDQKIQTLIFA